MTHRIISPFSDVHGTPGITGLRGKNETQLIYGEEFIVESIEGEWTKGYCAHDGYKGYIESRNLSDKQPTPTHIITEARSHIYPEAHMKSLPHMILSFGSLIAVTETKEKFSKVEGLGWIHSRHLAPIDSTDADIVETAKKFLNTPYYWGGRSAFGIDCSGLIQLALARAGIKIGRDVSDQEGTFGQKVDRHRTGDIVYMKDSTGRHVGIMVDEENMIHSNATHMNTVIELLWKVEERGGEITSVVRI